MTANRADPDEMPNHMASRLDQHCLPMFHLHDTRFSKVG